MTDEILKEKLKILSPKQIEIINEYGEHDFRKLKRIAFNAFKGFNIPNAEHDDLYDEAIHVLMESVVSYDGNKEVNFNTYLTNNIKNSIRTWYRDNYKRGKRKNLVKDEHGKIKRDEKGNPFIVHDMSFDAPAEDDESSLKERVASDFNVEEESQFAFDVDEKVFEFLDSLPAITKRFLELKMEGEKPDRIREILNISESEYSRHMKLIKTNEKLELFTKSTRYKEDTNMNIMPIDVTDSYRMDKYPLGTLLDEKRDKKINCKYILQRQPFQWTKRQKNKFLTRILNNQPIPEIVICEQIVGDKKKRHLIDGLQRLSYASQYRAKGSVIEADGAEFADIYYTEYVMDDDGNYVLDEDGDPKVEKKVFNVIGKKFDQLPSFLQERFNKFNVNVTTFFNCTDEQIAYHIRNYNNQAPMNNNQYDMTCMNPEFAEMIKDISQNNPFFKDKHGSFTNSNDIKGAVDRLVAECVMSVNFIDDWKDKSELLFSYIEKHATKNMFDHLSKLFTRLCNVVNKNTKELFNTGSTSAWLAVFNKFTEYDMEDSKFGEFLEYFVNNINTLKSSDGEDFIKIYKDRHPKNKGIVTAKIENITYFMNEFLHIKSEDSITEETDNNEVDDEDSVDNENVDTTLTEDTLFDFIKDNVDSNVKEDDVSFYEDILNDCIDANEMKIDQMPIYQNCKTALVSMAAYACSIDKDDMFEKWIKKYENLNCNFSPSQVINFRFLKRDFDNYINLHNNTKMVNTRMVGMA